MNNEYIIKVYEETKNKNIYEKEFLQAVHEVLIIRTIYWTTPRNKKEWNLRKTCRTWKDDFF